MTRLTRLAAAGLLFALSTIIPAIAADEGKTPDYAAAERFYDTALRIDPNHRGALEYSGELYLMLGNLPKAEERRERLARLCAPPCEQLEKLSKAIDNYKAAGNKYVPEE